MERIALLLALVGLLALVASPALAVEGPWEHPVIKAAGEAVCLPQAKVQPDPSLKYKIVCDITKDKIAKGKVVPGLAKVARLLNVYACGGMGPDKLEVVLVMHGPATEAVLTPAAYEKKHGFANPNLELIDQLAAAGVKMFVCGQALKEHDIAAGDISPKFAPALSALTVLPTYQLRGYALMLF